MDAKYTVIGERLGDSDIVASLPGMFQGLGRRLGGTSMKSARRRLLRAIERLFPRLRQVEALVMPPEPLLLQDQEADEILSDPDRLERGWKIFQAAWQAGLVVLRDLDGDPIPYGRNGLETACCGLSMDDIERQLVVIAAERIFAENEAGLEKLDDVLDGLEDLPKLRILVHLDPLRLDQLREGFGPRFKDLFFRMPLEQLHAVTLLQPHALHALRQAMGREFLEIVDWNADYLVALAESFQVVEQYRDLGPYVTNIKDPETIRVLGRFGTRDVTEQVNRNRIKQGKQKLKGRRFETDIAVISHVLGKHFEDLLIKPPELVEAIGQFLATTRSLAGPERSERYQDVSTFASRYMEYMTADMVSALRLVGDNKVMAGEIPPDTNQDPTFGEIMSLLDGLWDKQGFGRPFFEGPFQTPRGAKAMAGLVRDFLVMKQRGSVKGEEVSKILATTHLLDNSLRGLSSVK